MTNSLCAALLACALISTLGCNTSRRVDAANRDEHATASSRTRNTTAAQNPDPGINLDCVYDRLRDPRESFSYSYTKDTSDDEHIAQEADVTPQSIDGRARHSGSDHAVPFQATRSDQQSWSSALANLTAISGMSSTIAVVNHGSAMKRESDGTSTNGYSTIHYSIDTARFDATERGILGPTMGPGGSEKGDAWVTADGCPVKLALDSEMHKNDGSLLEKIHYEESMVKK